MERAFRPQGAKYFAGPILLLLVLYAFVLLFPGVQYLYRPSQSLIVVNPLALQLIGTTALVGIGLIVTAARSIRKGLALGWGVLAIGGLSPVVCLIGLFRCLGPYHVDSVLDPNGARYHLFEDPGRDGPSFLVAKAGSEGVFRSGYYVLGHAAGDWENGSLTVVRPAAGGGEPRLYLTPRQMLVVLPFSNQATFCFDLASGKIYGTYCEAIEKEACGALDELSPFLLLDADDVPNGEDFAATMLGPERVSAVAVAADFHHPNPRVQTMARQLYRYLLAHPNMSAAASR